MKIASVEVENLLSFRSRTLVEFDPIFNVLVGPNGGGKSNLVDIVMVLLRRFFLQGYRLRRSSEDSGRTYKDLYTENVFSYLPSVLPTYGGNSEPWRVTLTLLATGEDLEFMTRVAERRDRLGEILSEYRNKPIQSIDVLLSRWTSISDRVSPGDLLAYNVTSERCDPTDDKARVFLDYLRDRAFVERIAGDSQDIKLPSTYLYFSPYRAVSEQSVRANLVGTPLSDLVFQYHSTMSRSDTSLLKLGSTYFASKRRRLEADAATAGFGTRWETDSEVRMVSKYAERLGYRWDLKCVDPDKNTYEVLLISKDHSFLLEQASSGEREILSFLLGIFGLETRGGVIVIDEPELHLHTKWQTVLRDLLSDLATHTKNQIVVATHSASFITRDNVQKVIRIHREPGKGSVVSCGLRVTSLDQKSLLHVVTSHNNEKMFFADRVVLVEGIMDRLLFASLLDLFGSWLNRTEVIEVIEVHGKTNFKDYEAFLKCIGQKYHVIADLDYVRNIGTGSIKSLFEPDYERVVEKIIDDKKSLDRKKLIKLLHEASRSGDLSKMNLAELRSLVDHMASRTASLRGNLSEDERHELLEFMARLRNERLIILSRGEIEDYLPSNAKSLEGLIRLVRPEALKKWLAERETSDLTKKIVDITLDVLGTTQDERDEVFRLAKNPPQEPTTRPAE